MVSPVGNFEKIPALFLEMANKHPEVPETTKKHVV